MPATLCEPVETTPETLEVSVVMPCLNEARTVGTCVAKAKGTLDSMGVAGEVIAMPIAWRLLPKPEQGQKHKHDFDPVGVVLLGAGVVVLLLPLVQEQQWKGGAKWLLIPAAGGQSPPPPVR